MAERQPRTLDSFVTDALGLKEMTILRLQTINDDLEVRLAQAEARLEVVKDLKIQLEAELARLEKLYPSRPKRTR